MGDSGSRDPQGAMALEECNREKTRNPHESTDRQEGEGGADESVLEASLDLRRS